MLGDFNFLENHFRYVIRQNFKMAFKAGICGIPFHPAAKQA